jgi:hypothetical protein
LDYVDAYYGSMSDCESAVKTKLADIYDNVRNRLNSEKSSRPYVECVMRDIEEDDDDSYELIVLKETAIEWISNWRFWKYFSKSSRIEELQGQAENIIRNSLIKCKGNREYGDLFNNILDKNIRWERRNEQEYCIRKVLVEKGLVNPVIYNFQENPKNVRTERYICKDIFQEIVDQLYEEVKTSKNVNDCVLNAYKSNGYAENVLTAELFSKLMLTRSDRSKERQNFINKMVDISYDTKKC